MIKWINKLMRENINEEVFIKIKKISKKKHLQLLINYLKEKPSVTQK